MLALNLSADDFLSALHALLPTGRAWSTDSDSVQTKTLQGVAPTFARQTARSNYLLTDGFPASTNELLPEWELSLGLPDPCAGESPSLQQRRAQVIARFAKSGGQSAEYFIAFAATLGYEISVNNYVPARAGQARCGDACNSEAWAFAWSVTVPLSTVTYARAGQSTAGEPLATWGNDVLQCELESIKPAHTILLFKYLTQIFDNSVVTALGRPIVTSHGRPVVL